MNKPLQHEHEREQGSIESLKYQLRQWRKLVTKYLPPTECDRDDVAEIDKLLSSSRSPTDLSECTCGYPDGITIDRNCPVHGEAYRPPARHEHEAGAPLTDDCDNWCECKYKGYMERLDKCIHGEPLFDVCEKCVEEGVYRGEKP